MSASRLSPSHLSRQSQGPGLASVASKHGHSGCQRLVGLGGPPSGSPRSVAARLARSGLAEFRTR